MRILVVCTGNLCRSPMVESLLRHRLAERGCADIEVSSTGTWAVSGEAATVEARAVMAERGMDIASHRSRPLDAAELGRAELVVAMTSVHAREIASIDPAARSRTVLIKELAEMKPKPVEDGAKASERLRALLYGQRPRWRRALDLDDPMGLPRGAYERCLAEIERGVDALVAALCPSPRK